MTVNKSYNFSGKKIWIAGHNGLLGGALLRAISCYNCQVIKSSRGELDLTNQTAVNLWLKKNKPDVIFIAAAKVGGIKANSELPANFIFDNLMIQTNIIHGAYLNSIARVIFFGSSCSYPKNAEQPISESQLLTGKPELTNLPYSIAKIAGMQMIEAYANQYGCDFISCIPTNTYGPGDNFNLDTSHVIPSMIRKLHEAKVNKLKEITFWGTGEPLREFLFINDLAEAAIFLSENYFEKTPINIGSGHEISIKDLAFLIAQVVGYDGLIDFDIQKPDGMKRKALNSEKINKLGWKPSIELEFGIETTYRWFLDNPEKIRY